MTESVPSGTRSSEYSDWQSSDTDIVTWGDKVLEAVTKTAFSALIGYLFSGWLGLIAGFGAELYDSFVEQEPKATAISVAENMYYHEDGFSIGGNRSVEKYKYHWYGTKNFSNLLEITECYRVYEY